MRIMTALTLVLLTASTAYAVESPASDDALYDTREEASDSNTITRVGNRLSTQPGLRECAQVEDCAVIEGVCSGSEAVNITRAEAKQHANRNARSVADCENSYAPDPDFNVRGVGCVNNECVLTKRRR